ncbi:hypothetical protein P8452_76934 [Trifolium repens]|nr:hypothetical protein P8452_76934 [Trifolium repens]
MDTRAEKDKKFNIAFTTLSDLEKGQKCDAELARHLMTKMEKSTLLSKQLIWAKVAQHKVNVQEKLIMPKTIPSISSSNQYFFGKNFANRVLLLKIAMIGKLQLDELKSWLGSHWGCDSMFENILFFFQSSRRAFALPELLLLFDNVLGEDLWTEI